MPESNAAATNAEAARRYFEVVYNLRQPERIGEFAHADGVAYQTSGVMVGRHVVRESVVERFLGAFPDLHVTVDDLMAVDDQVVVRWIAEGTHLGEGLGVPPTGERIALHGMTWLVFRDGRITKGWDCYDHGGMLERLYRAAHKDRT